MDDYNRDRGGAVMVYYAVELGTVENIRAWVEAELVEYERMNKVLDTTGNGGYVLRILNLEILCRELVTEIERLRECPT